MSLKKFATLLTVALACILPIRAQQNMPTSGDVTVRIAEPIDFATARPLQAVRSVVVSSTNPVIPTGSLAVLQLQNRDGSYALKLLRINAAGQVLKTMSQPGTSVSGPPASGPHATLASGALVRFTLTQQDGSPGAPVMIQGGMPATGATQTGLSGLSETAWTAYPNQGGVVPDAALIGEVPLMNGTDERRKVAIQIGCDDRGGTKQPVFRFVLPHATKFDLSALGTTPTTVRAKDKVVMQFDLFTGPTDDLFSGNRMMYFAKKQQQQDIVQYDADPRELGAFAAPQNVGKVANFTIGDGGPRKLGYKIPPVDAVVTAVIKACNAMPYAGTNELSPKYSAALASVTEAINAYTAIADNRPDALPALEGIVITTPEWNAYRDLQDFYNVSLIENGKAKSRIAPPRRKRCADALIAEFKTGSYKAAPAPCAYLAKEAPL